MKSQVALAEAALQQFTARQRAMLKLQFGGLALSGDELSWIPLDKRDEATIVRPRTLDEVAGLIGVTRERVRQVNLRSLRRLGVSAE